MGMLTITEKMSDVDRALVCEFMDACDVAEHLGVDLHSVNDALLGYVFNNAVETDLIDTPPDGDTELGAWYVPEQYRTDFINRLKKHIPLGTLYDGAPTKFKSNPTEIIEKFFRWNDGPGALVRLMTDDGEYDQSLYRRILRMTEKPNGPKKTTTKAYRSQYLFADKVVKAMAAKDARFAKYTAKDLLWIVEVS
jgi:hypothetical protein